MNKNKIQNETEIMTCDLQSDSVISPELQYIHYTWICDTAPSFLKFFQNFPCFTLSDLLINYNNNSIVCGASTKTQLKKMIMFLHNHRENIWEIPSDLILHYYSSCVCQELDVLRQLILNIHVLLCCFLHSSMVQ